MMFPEPEKTFVVGEAPAPRRGLLGHARKEGLTSEELRSALADPATRHQVQVPHEALLTDSDLRILLEAVAARTPSAFPIGWLAERRASWSAEAASGMPSSAGRAENIAMLGHAIAVMESGAYLASAPPPLALALEPSRPVESPVAARNSGEERFLGILKGTSTLEGSSAGSKSSWSSLHREGSQPGVDRFRQVMEDTLLPRLEADSAQGSVERLHSGLFLSRSFRVGWGPNGELVHGGIPISKVTTPKGVQDQEIDQNDPTATQRRNFAIRNRGGGSGLGYVVHLEKLRVGQLGCVGTMGASEAGADEAEKREEELRRRCIQMLRVHFGRRKHFDGNGAVLRLDGDSDMLPPICQQFFTIATSQDPDLKDDPGVDFMRDSPAIWDLVNILWGSAGLRTDRTPKNDRPEAQPVIERLRRNALHGWLRQHACHVPKSELPRCEDLGAEEATAARILHCLCTNDLQGACAEARAAKDHRLGLLLSQAHSSSRSSARDLVREQVAAWKASRAWEKHISPGKRRLYEILAGDASHEAVSSSQDAPMLMRWRQRLGLEYWYTDCRRVQDALGGYVERHESVGGAPVPAPPLPVYMESMREELPRHRLEEAREAPGSRLRCDAALELLVLHKEERQGEELESSLRRVVHPQTSSPLPLDVHMSWFLSEVLSLHFKSYGFETEASCHVAFASELELLGAWEWSIYVLLSTPIANTALLLPRILLRVREILARHAGELCEEPMSEESKAKEAILRVLYVGGSWNWEAELHQAKAMRYGYLGEVEKESHHYLEMSKLQDYARIDQVVAPLSTKLAPAQVLKEPPYYVEATLDLWPSAWFIAERMGVNPLALQENAEGEKTPLRFRVQVEIWADEAHGALRYKELRGQGKETTVDVLYLSIKNTGEGQSSWRLDVSKMEAQSALLKALKLPEKLTVHDTSWEPIPSSLTSAAAARELVIRDARVHIRLEENLVFEHFEALSALPGGLAGLEPRYEAPFYHSMYGMPEPCNFDPNPNCRSAPFYNYMRDVRETGSSALDQGLAAESLHELRSTAKLVQTGEFFRRGGASDPALQDGAGGVPPNREETLPVRAALDHVGCHILRRVAPEEVLECVEYLGGERRDGKEGLLPASESARSSLLHKACDSLFV